MESVQDKLIVVIGATGLQGSSVAKAFLTTNRWRVRCITRNTNSPKAKELADLGCELHQTDLSDRGGLVKAFQNASAIFANTDFWTTYYHRDTPDRAAGNGRSLGEHSFDVEVAHGKNIADAAAQVPSLERLIYSGLPAMNKDPEDKFADCFHWDAKAIVIDYIKSQTALRSKLSVIYLAAYMDNPFIIPRWDEGSESYKIMMPMRPQSRLPTINPASSTGPYVKILVEEEPAGTNLLAYDTDSYLEARTFADLWAKQSGLSIVYENTPQEYMAEKFNIPTEILAGPILIDRHSYMHGVDNYIEPYQLKEQIRMPSYEEWLKEHWNEFLPSGDQ